jgi:2-dehydropantoate 2-reductase
VKSRFVGLSPLSRIVANTMAFLDMLSPGSTPSIQQDIQDGRLSELDAWNEAVVRLARQTGLSTPLHTFIYHRL